MSITVHSRVSLMAIDLSASLAAERERIDRAWHLLANHGISRGDVMDMTLSELLDLAESYAGPLTPREFRNIRRAVILVSR